MSTLGVFLPIASGPNTGFNLAVWFSAKIMGEETCTHDRPKPAHAGRRLLKCQQHTCPAGEQARQTQGTAINRKKIIVSTSPCTLDSLCLDGKDHRRRILPVNLRI